MATEPWQIELANASKNIDELRQHLHINEQDWYSVAGHQHNDFSMRIPKSYLARIKPGDIKDPLLLQVLAQAQEMVPTPGYHNDPLLETRFNPVPGLLHKYHGRVLWLLTGACAIHCRYCFRRHFGYQEQQLNKSNHEAIFHYLEKNVSIREVILSGGDPLSVKDHYLESLLNRIDRIDHIRRIRIHTRLPIAIPGRVTPKLLSLARLRRANFVLVIHCNHPQEIDDEVRQALKQFQANGICVFNQSVLLKSINDNANTLIELSEALFSCGVIPYYLHLLDPVSGAAHFDVTVERAQHIMQILLTQLPGYLVPKLVREIPGCPAKSPILINFHHSLDKKHITS